MPAATSRTLKLAAIGTAGGVFSGLLGVGGGSVIVPLLIIWLGYGAREATGTSMMAIVVIAAVAVTLQAFYGNVDPPNAALVGIPAIAGAFVGTALQQRISERLISVLFALLLIVIAIELIIPCARSPQQSWALPAGWSAGCWGWGAVSSSSRRW